MAFVKSVPKPFLEKRYITLSGKSRLEPTGLMPGEEFDPLGVHVSVRQAYINHINDIICQINKGDHIEFKQVGKRSGNRQTAAYISYYFSPHGATIQITPLFWDLVESRQLSDIIRELGRREGFHQENADDPLYDDQWWEDTVEYLAQKYDELMAKKKEP